MPENRTRHAARTIAITALITVVASTPAAAVHDSVPCSPPESLMPLFNLLHSIVELTFLGGIVLATLGFITAGILLMIPGEDNSRRGKLVARNVLFGTVLLLSSSMIVRFFVSQTGSGFCT
ncbi:TrbC/VirB2 family protein [Halobellus rubicundus]|uniref:TrbC/VirB2 family protein n=1 Tax=Halobellus rubicundus TaxID=2996466 RepID=A0ABD5MDE3_9EURY